MLPNWAMLQIDRWSIHVLITSNPINAIHVDLLTSNSNRRAKSIPRTPYTVSGNKQYGGEVRHIASKKKRRKEKWRASGE